MTGKTDVFRRVRLLFIPAGVMLLCACSFLFAQADDESNAVQPREEFSLELPKISVSIDEETREFDGVRITMPGEENQIVIGTFDDMEIKNSKEGREKVLYRELPEKAGYFTKFEIKTILKVNKYFISSVEDFDKFLQKSGWGKCCYFDAFFPHFLSGYYYLICAARNSEAALPLGARIPEKEYDVSLNSLKTDYRINRWRSSPDTVIKLRIISKELVHQLKIWQKNLEKTKENDDVATPKELEEALTVFIRAYFCLRLSSTGVLKKVL